MSVAHGQEPAPPVPDDEATAIEKRPVRAADLALALPRAALLLPRAATTLAFAPLRPVIRWGAKHNLLERYERLVYWNEERTFGLRPGIGYNNIFGPTVTAKLFHNDIGGYGESASLSASFGGSVVQAYEARFEADRLGGSRVWTDAIGRYERNPNVVFGGFSSDELTPVTRYSQTRWLALLGGGVTLGPTDKSVQLGGTAIFNNREFGPPINDKRVATGDVYDTSELIGFDEGLNTLELSAVVRVDASEGGIRPRGVFAEGFIGPVWTTTGETYIHGGFDVQASAPLYRRTRMVMVHLFTESAWGDDTPFTDLPRLGGTHRLRGYRADRFRDQYVAGGTLAYSWPVHKNAQAQAFVDVGTAVPSVQDILRRDPWRAGAGVSMLIGSEEDVDLRVDLAYGDGFFIGVGSDLQRPFRNRGTRL